MAGRASGAVQVLSQESCLVSLDYAYSHVLCCALQALVLLLAGRTRHFRAAHAFGLFAMLADYAVAFMTTGTRTITYPHLAPDLDRGWLSGDEPLGPIGEFLFFSWFSYSAFGLLLWAKSFEDFAMKVEKMGWHKAAGSTTCVDWFGLVVVPVQFWSAPLLSPFLNIDSRILLLQRSSPKYLYLGMLFIFPLVLKQFTAYSKKRVSIIWLSGLGCACIHHLPLYLFGMRGYNNVLSLLITLLTEWPALIMGIATVEALGGCLYDTVRGHWSKKLIMDGTSLFSSLMWLALAVLMTPHLTSVSDKDALAYLIPLVPGQHMQSLGTAYLRGKTCLLPKYLPSSLREESVDCWTDSFNSTDSNHGDDFLVMATAAKSGAVLSARLVAEIGVACGLCVASGERSGPGIPGPIESLPAYEGRLLHAIINMWTWPDYVTNLGYNTSSLLQPVEVLPGGKSSRVRCVVLIRDPVARLRSLYTYARSGGEHWFRYGSNIMHQLSDPSLTLEQSVMLFWETFGRDYLLQSHDYLMMNIALGCHSIKMESLQKNFSASVVDMLRVYGISESAIPHIIDRVRDSDLNTKSVAEQRRDAHVTANKFSPELIEKVKHILTLGIPELMTIVQQQRLELGYLKL